MIKFLIFLGVIFLGIQLIPVDKTNPPVDATIALDASKEVMDILQRSCYDCHSFETKWPSYSAVAPLSFSIANHVSEGRKALNFSTWKQIDAETKIKRLERAIKTVNNGMMPLPSYLRFHEEALLSDGDKQIVVDWCQATLKTVRSN